VVAKLERHADQLGALGHPVRLRILRHVVQAGPEGVAAGELQARLDIPASTLSFHLKRLAQAALLTARSEGTFLYYAADYPALRALTEYLWEDCCKSGATKGGSSSCC
jgi:DNA-binding transcriptional ArsR family regulator